jgi:hypothetical protein
VAGGDINWSIASGSDTTDFVITGSPGSQVLSLTAAGSSLAAGASESVHIVSATTGKDVSGTTFSSTLSNTATVTTPGHEQAGGETSSSASATTSVVAPDVDITKTPDQATIAATQQAGFTVKITNESTTAAASGISLTDNLPGGTGSDVYWTIDTGTGNPGDFTISGTQGHQTLSLTSAGTTLAAGASISVHITSPTNLGDAPAPTYSGTLPNTATVTAPNQAGGETSESASATITVVAPSITTTTGGTVTLGSGSLSDSATLSGGLSPVGGSITFRLYLPSDTTYSSPIYTKTVNVSGDGTYGYAKDGSVSYMPTTANGTGTYEWVATYNGDGTNPSVNSGQGNEPETVNPASPSVSTTPGATSTVGGGGQFATIGFWHNKNGQAVINNFDSGPTSTKLGNSLTTNYKNLFGFSNPFISNLLAGQPPAGTAGGLAGLTNSQIATLYKNLWTPKGLQKNTYIQAFAVAFGLYATGGQGSFNVGNNGAAFGVANGTTLPITTILATASSNFDPTLGVFYGGDSAKTSQLNNVLNNINQSGDKPGGITVVSSNTTLTDSATLSGGVNPKGTITFYLLPPGSTPTSDGMGGYTNLSALAVYTATVNVNGDNTYTTSQATSTTGSNVPTQTGTYQWVAVYTSSDGNNSNFTPQFGLEPWTVGQQSPTVLSTTPNVTAVTLNGTSVTLTDTANLTNLAPGGTGDTMTFYLMPPSANTSTDFTQAVFSSTVSFTINPDGTATVVSANCSLPSNAAAGVYQWDAVYSGDQNNTGDSFLNDPTERVVVSSAGTQLGRGQTATIGFWKNAGQQVILNFGATASGQTMANWLATNYPNLFSGFANQSNAYVANQFANGSSNTWLQAFAVAMDIYATTTTLGGQSVINNGYTTKYGFTVGAAGAGAGLWSVGNNGASFGVPNNTSLTVATILSIADLNYSPGTGKFYGGDATLTNGLNVVLNAINERNDIKLVAEGSSYAGPDVPLLASSGDLRTGVLGVSVDSPSGVVTADEQARIDDAIAILNTDLGGHGITLVDVTGTDAAADAGIRIHLADTSVIGGAADGVLGVTEFGGDVTLIDTWNFYFGTDPGAVGADQYDFQTVTTHELGHAIGLGHSTDTSSVMYPSLGMGEARRDLTANDLAVIDKDAGTAPEPLLAAGYSAPGVRAAQTTAVITAPNYTATVGLPARGWSIVPTVATTAFTAALPQGLGAEAVAVGLRGVSVNNLSADRFVEFASPGILGGQPAPLSSHDLGLQSFLQDRGTASDISVVPARSVLLTVGSPARTGETFGLESLVLIPQSDGAPLSIDTDGGSNDVDGDAGDGE